MRTIKALAAAIAMVLGLGTTGWAQSSMQQNGGTSRQMDQTIQTDESNHQRDAGRHMKQAGKHTWQAGKNLGSALVDEGRSVKKGVKKGYQYTRRGFRKADNAQQDMRRDDNMSSSSSTGSGSTNQ
jgi:uncharacterized protein HemX